ncbi:MAG: sugar ABC transporter permease [Clostridiales bacterium]|jgi:multiple sugar transport system permease protein/alpha-1,4-digalacturonate transport system permease protein|nr:sugar ABC transporter permease [Clostridiales bacterium]MDR2750274.1 sugar ABC transporter permease [Clostridiales bacterium]
MSRQQRREALAGYLYILPNFIGFLIFTGIPVFIGLGISFTNYKGFPGAKFVGVANYLQLFKDTLFKTALRNNLAYSFSVVPLTILVSLLLALMLNKAIPLGGFFKTVYFFPNLTSMVAVGCVALLLFEPTKGPINQFLRMLGMPQESLPGWFFSSKTALATVVITVVWKQAGYYMIMFLGGLKNIPSHLYEAAKIDGANPWQIFWSVTWPMLTPTTFMVAILCFIASFQTFDIINVTTAGGPGRATSVLVFRIYREAFSDWKMGYASAIAYFLFMIILVVTLVQWHGQKNWVVEDD